jgi:peptide deformylase
VAANQIGVGLAVFSYFVNGKSGYLINPEILELSGDEVELEEGCLSLPGLWHKTPRFQKAVVRGQLLDGTTVEITGEGVDLDQLRAQTKEQEAGSNARAAELIDTFLRRVATAPVLQA